MRRVLMYDRFVLFLIQKYRTPSMNRILSCITKSGNGGAVWIFTGLCYAVIPGNLTNGLLFFCCMTACAVVNNLLIKSMFRRERPCDRFADVPLLIKRPCGSSFPSGHTAISFACASALLYLCVPLGTAALLLAAVIGYTRVYFFVHFPSDVLFGIISGVFTTLTVIGISCLI